MPVDVLLAGAELAGVMLANVELASWDLICKFLSVFLTSFNSVYCSKLFYLQQKSVFVDPGYFKS